MKSRAIHYHDGLSMRMDFPGTSVCKYIFYLLSLLADIKTDLYLFPSLCSTGACMSRTGLRHAIAIVVQYRSTSFPEPDRQPHPGQHCCNNRMGIQNFSFLSINICSPPADDYWFSSTSIKLERLSSGFKSTFSTSHTETLTTVANTEIYVQKDLNTRAGR